MEANITTALLLTAAAGMATVLGSFIGLAVRNPGPRFMSFTLGFSAGVMVLVSFVELLPSAIGQIGFIPAHGALLAGMFLYFLIDYSIPHDYIGQHDHPESMHENLKLQRTGLLVAIGIGIHNFPEGMATFVGALQDVNLGIAIACAIAIHNIPEGIAVSAPVYAATKSRSKAFWLSFLSGATEPLGAALAALVLMPYLNETILGWVLASVSGIMIAISLDELVPTAKEYDTEHTPILGVIAGMAVMAASLWMLR
ncbi:MAG TPA: zinc transporter ZupT [bacterium]|nr:zinc transporter ZupT [bacterium]